MIYIDILILAMIAIFILNRLRSVLGKKTGNEPDFVERITTRKNTSSETKPDLEINTKKKDLLFITMTNYDESFVGIKILYEKENLNNNIC